MATVKALHWSGITLASGHVVEFGKPLVTDNETLRQTDNQRTFPALIAAGLIAVEYDPDPAPEEAPVAPPPAETPPPQTEPAVDEDADAGK